jgi:proteasome accessory factor C
MSAPKYVQRIARLPEVFAQLMVHPGGLPLTELATEVGVPVDELREDLLAFYTADLNPMLFGLSRPSVLEFLGPDGDDVDPNEAEVVRVVDERPGDELGVEYVTASALGLVYSAAKARLDLDPDDDELRGAMDVLTETMVGEALPEAPARAWNQPLESLEDAVAAHRTVRITYSRTWSQGVNERVIEPYLLVKTRRGWEVDAGPPDDQGRLRTFLLPHIRQYAVLDDTFTPPPNLDALLAAQRTTTRVRVQVPHAARWAADFYAENVEVVADDELAATLDLDLLPPVEHRVGLLVLIAGEDARVLDPATMISAGPKLAAELLAHHRSDAAG